MLILQELQEITGDRTMPGFSSQAWYFNSKASLHNFFFSFCLSNWKNFQHLKKAVAIFNFHVKRLK